MPSLLVHSLARHVCSAASFSDVSLFSMEELEGVKAGGDSDEDSCSEVGACHTVFSNMCNEGRHTFRRAGYFLGAGGSAARGAQGSTYISVGEIENK